jgi:hypothetical protein
MREQDEFTPFTHPHDDSVLAMAAAEDNKKSTADSPAERTTISDRAVSPPSIDAPANEKTEEPPLRPTGWKWPVLTAVIYPLDQVLGLSGEHFWSNHLIDIAHILETCIEVLRQVYISFDNYQ